MRASLSFFGILCSGLISFPGMAGSSGGSGPPQKMQVSPSEFEYLSRFSPPIVSEALLHQEIDRPGVQRSYWIEAGDSADELILTERRARVRQQEGGNILYITKARIE